MSEIAYTMRMYYTRFADTMQRGETIGTEITKFGKAQDIPSIFIRNKVPQSGTVKLIVPSEAGSLLRVDHHPPINVFFASKKTLPVKIFGVKINGNGHSWLQCVAVNHSVKFIPILRDGENAVCQVFLLQPKSSKPTLDLASSLTSLGFAQVDQIPNDCVGDLSLTAYHKNLLNIQNKSKRSRSGQWADIVAPQMWPIPQVQKLSWKALYNILPIKRRLPELVR